MLLYMWMGEDRGSGERVPAFHLYIARRSHCTCRVRLSLLWVGGMPAQVVQHNNMSLEIWDFVLPGFLRKFGPFFCDDRVMIVLMIKSTFGALEAIPFLGSKMVCFGKSVLGVFCLKPFLDQVLGRLGQTH